MRLRKRARRGLAKAATGKRIEYSMTMETQAETGELVQSKSAGNRAAYPRKSHGRSRVSNGHDLLPDIDGRSIIARRYRDITSAIMADQGGADQCSESRKQLIRRFAAAAVLAEQLESRLVSGETIDIAEHATLSSTLVRLAQRIGINRVPHDITPDPLTYASEHEHSAGYR
jgi:hypothetical protein